MGLNRAEPGNPILEGQTQQVCRLISTAAGRSEPKPTWCRQSEERGRPSRGKRWAAALGALGARARPAEQRWGAADPRSEQPWAVLELCWQVEGHCPLLTPPDTEGRQVPAEGSWPLHPRPGHPSRESPPGIHSSFRDRRRGGWSGHTHSCAFTKL